jgi:hypothetical protein
MLFIRNSRYCHAPRREPRFVCAPLEKILAHLLANAQEREHDLVNDKICEPGGASNRDQYKATGLASTRRENPDLTGRGR